MERVAFLIEDTGEHIACMLNPEDVVVRRIAGVRRRRSAGGVLTGAGLADDVLLYTGGGMTEMFLNLLFDVTLGGSSNPASDVRELTYPMWQLAENDSDVQNYGRPPLVRFVWGKSWNIPGVVASVAERFDYFSPQGDPLRSWLRMRFLRVADPPAQRHAEARQIQEVQLPDLTPVQPVTETGAVPAQETGEYQTHLTAVGDRLDQLVHQYYGYFGHPSLWRWLAQYNGVSDPLHIEPGTVLQIPPLSLLEAKA